MIPALLLAFRTLIAGTGRPLEFVPLRMVERQLIESDMGERLYSVRFVDPAGNPVDAYLRKPVREELRGADDSAEFPGVVLVAGRFAGREAAAMIPGPLETVMLAVEYPQAIPPRMSVREWLQALPSIRRSARQMPGILRGAANYLAAEPGIDSTRLALVGVSFGVPFAAAAGKDPIFQGVALHYGGTNLASLFRANLPIENGWMRRVVAGFAGWWFREMDPGRHVAAISPTPLLLINAMGDVQIPRESALRLAQRAKPPVHHIWLPYGHITSSQSAVIREVADSTFRYFGFQGN